MLTLDDKILTRSFVVVFFLFVVVVKSAKILVFIDRNLLILSMQHMAPSHLGSCRM